MTQWAAAGIDDVRIFVQWQAIAPGELRGQGADGLRLRRSEQPRLRLVARRPRGEPGQRRGHAPAARRHGAGSALGLTGARAPQRPLQAASRPLRAVRARRGAALRRAVDRWIIWNEPNLPLWLQPQNTCKGKRCTPTRRISTGASCARPTRRSRPSTRPRRCSSARWRPTARTRPSRTPGRARWPSSARWAASRSRSSAIAAGRAPASSRSPPTAWPTTRTPPSSRPTSSSRFSTTPRSATSRGSSARSTHAARGRPQEGRRRQVPLYFTEWGYQTRPPDRTRGVSLAQQSRYLQQGAYLAYATPACAADAVRVARRARAPQHGGDRYAGWQSGLRFVNDKAKPAFKTFANPFFIDQRPGSRSARLWGQVRPGVTHRVTVQRRKAGTRSAGPRSRCSRPTAAATGRCARRSRRPPTTASAGSPPTPYGAPTGPVKTSDVLRVSIKRKR